MASLLVPEKVLGLASLLVPEWALEVLEKEGGLGHIHPLVDLHKHLDNTRDKADQADLLETEAHYNLVGSPLDRCILADEDFPQRTSNREDTHQLCRCILWALEKVLEKVLEKEGG